jgi:hypothetical protein
MRHETVVPGQMYPSAIHSVWELRAGWNYTLQYLEPVFFAVRKHQNPESRNGIHDLLQTKSCNYEEWRLLGCDAV